VFLFVLGVFGGEGLGDVFEVCGILDDVVLEQVVSRELCKNNL